MQQKPSPARRRMTRREYERLQRQRRQNRIAIAIMAGIAVVVIAAVILILRPKGAPDSAAPAMVSAEVNASEQADDIGNTAEDGTEPTEAEAGQAGDAAVEPTPDPLPEPLVTPVPAASVSSGGDGTLRSVRMRVVGDIMMCQTQLVFARDSGYDFHNQFELSAGVLQNADYTMGNMEGTVGKYKDSNYSGYPQFNCPDVVLEALKDVGFDFLTLANNHMLDRWADGLKNTVNWVEKYGLDHVGAYRTKEERNAPVIYEIGGIKFGFVAYTHSTNTMEDRGADPKVVAYAVPYLQKADFSADIKKLRDAGAEVVIAFPHWGAEYVRTPDSSQKKYAKRLASAGADIIIGSHSHMVQPMGFQKLTDDAGRERSVFTMFSMGNFISDHAKQYTDAGVIVEFTVNERQDGTFTCDDVAYIPTYTWQQDGGVRVLPSSQYLDHAPEGMNDESYRRMRESYNEIVEVLGTEFPVLAE